MRSTRTPPNISRENSSSASAPTLSLSSVAAQKNFSTEHLLQLLKGKDETIELLQKQLAESEARTKQSVSEYLSNPSLPDSDQLSSLESLVFLRIEKSHLQDQVDLASVSMRSLEAALGQKNQEVSYLLDSRKRLEARLNEITKLQATLKKRHRGLLETWSDLSQNADAEKQGLLAKNQELVKLREENALLKLEKAGREAESKHYMYPAGVASHQKTPALNIPVVPALPASSVQFPRHRHISVSSSALFGSGNHSPLPSPSPDHRNSLPFDRTSPVTIHRNQKHKKITTLDDIKPKEDFQMGPVGGSGPRGYEEYVTTGSSPPRVHTMSLGKIQ